MKEADPVVALRMLIARAGGQKAAAVKLGCSPQFVSNMLQTGRVPDSILNQLGLRRTVVAVEK